MDAGTRNVLCVALLFVTYFPGLSLRLPRVLGY